MVVLLLTTIVLYTHNRRLFLLSTLVYVLSVFHSLYFKDGYYMAAILVIPAILYKGYELLVKEHYARIIQRKVRLGFYLLATFVSFVFIFYVFVLPRISWLFTFKINIDWLRFLYSDSLNIGTIQIVLSVISVITTTAILFKTSTRKNGSFLLISYSVLIIVLYSLFANRYFAPRYIYYFFPLYLAFLTNGLLIAFQKKLLQSILFSLISISILASTTAYFREDRSYSRFVGTYNYESKYLQIFLNQTVGSTDMIVTSNANELLFFSPQSLDCVDTYNTDKGYQTLCNIIPIEKVTSTFTPTSTSYVIADWKRDPFTGADNSVINDIFKVRTQVLNSDYRVYEVTY